MLVTWNNLAVPYSIVNINYVDLYCTLPITIILGFFSKSRKSAPSDLFQPIMEYNLFIKNQVWLYLTREKTSSLVVYYHIF